MFQFIQSQILLYTAIALVLFLPGYFLIMATKLNKHFSLLELFVIAFGSSIVIVDFLLIVLGKSPFLITKISVVGAITFFCSICGVIYFFKNKKVSPVFMKENKPDNIIPRKSAVLIVVLLFLTIFIKTIYFTDTIFPTTTDLGHHMYWSKIITTTGNLPSYEKADIGSDLTIEKPAPIADFIIGEHLIFAAISLISGADFISAFPALILFLIQIMSILTIFILTRSIFEKSHQHRDLIAVFSLFLVGPLYALSSPQAKFVSGGVIGNTIGNLLIPLAILFYIKAFTEKKARLLAWAFFISLGLAYTHHLSAFVFIFIFLFAAITFVALNFRKIKDEAKEWMKFFSSPSVPAVLIMGIIFIFLVYTPTYLNSEAIDTAVGAPSKASRAGLTLTQLKITAGEARFSFAIAGIILLIFARKIGKYKQSFLIGWIGALTLMSLKPNWLLVDIPSNRIASYIVFPAAIIAACMLAHIFIFLKDRHESDKNYFSPTFALVIFFTFMLFSAVNGFNDNNQTLNESGSASKAIQTYAASQYLNQQTNQQDMILKDHNYLSGDTWMKLFFMRGYNYPLSRGYFKRYEDSATREQCTNLMISDPASQKAQQCFAGTQTNFIIVNPKMDSAQFNKIKDFWQVYSSDEVGIFFKSS